MASYATVIDYVAAMMRGLSGVEEASDDAPESMEQFPFVVTIPLLGTFTKESPQMQGLHTMRIEVHVGKQILPEAIRTAIPFVDSIPAALWADPKLGGNVDTIKEIRGTFGRLEWGNETHIGWRFEFDFKIMTTV